MSPGGVLVAFVLCGAVGSVQSAPGIFSDLFHFEFSPPRPHHPPPPLRTIYVVKPTHGPYSHSHSSEMKGNSKIRYISKPPSHSSPFTSSPFSSGNGGGGGGGWGSPPKMRGKPRKPMKMPMSTMSIQGDDMDPELMAHLEGGGVNELAEDYDDGMMTGVRMPVEPETEVEGVTTRPPRYQGMRLVSNPEISGGYEEYASAIRKPSSSGKPHKLRKLPQKSVPVRYPDEPHNNGLPEDEDEKVTSVMKMPMPTRGSSSSDDKVRKPGGSRKPTSSSSHGKGWGPPPTTYVTHDGWGPPPSSHGWGWSPPPKLHGWSSPFNYVDVDDDYSEGWSSPYGGGGSKGWSSPSSGWKPGTGPSTPGGEEDEGEEPMSPMEPEDMTNEVPMDNAETPPPTSKPAKVRVIRPSSAPLKSALRGKSKGPLISNPLPSTSMAPPSEGTPTRPFKSRLPKTNEYFPEEDDDEGGESVSLRGGDNSSSNNKNNRGRNKTPAEFKIGNQVVSSQDGLLDEELISVVRQIINSFDKN